MNELVIDQLDDDVWTGLQRLAEFHGCTAAEMAAEILRRAVVVLADTPTVTAELGLGKRLAATFAGCGLDENIPELRA